VQVDLQPIDRVNLLVQDSQRKCAEFIDSLFAETAGSGLILDVLSTGTAAVSSVVTPLSTAHALGAASTLLGATKTGISANYLNTLSISHITQAILGNYTIDMKNYIDSLANAPDPARINVFQERSKILSYHSECSLAAAEGSIASALQTPIPAGQGLSLTYTVGDTEKTRADAAAALAMQIYGNTDFRKAGITARASGNIVYFAMTTAVALTVTSTPAGFASYVAGPPGQLAVIGIPKKGNTITIASPSAAQSSSTTGQTAGAAVAGTDPKAKQ
jgi:hypothetical protein